MDIKTSASKLGTNAETVLTSDNELLNNEVGFGGTSFNFDTDYDGYDPEDVEVEINSKDVMSTIIFILNKNPKKVKSMNLDIYANAEYIAEELSKVYQVEITLDDMVTLDGVIEFLFLISKGIIVSNKFTNAVKSSVKLYYLTSKDEDSVFLKQTNHGKLFRSIPIITTFSKAEINNTISKFFKNKFPILITDYYDYFVKDLQSMEVSRKIDEIGSIRHMEVSEMAKWIIDNKINKSDEFKYLLDNGVNQATLEKAKEIAKILSK